jgi:hypothetical protein
MRRNGLKGLIQTKLAQFYYKRLWKRLEFHCQITAKRRPWGLEDFYESTYPTCL